MHGGMTTQQQLTPKHWASAIGREMMRTGLTRRQQATVRRILDARREVGDSMAAIAERAGLSFATVRRYADHLTFGDLGRLLEGK